MGIQEISEEELKNAERAKRVLKLLKVEGLEEELREEVTELVGYNPWVYKLDDEKLSDAEVPGYRFKLKDDEPVHSRQFRLPFHIARKEVQAMLDAGVIEPSDSPYNAPAWMVLKKKGPDGEERRRIVILEMENRF